MSNFNFNKVILGGRLTVDPELKTTPTGVLVTSFSLAVNRKGSKNNEADFIECRAWRQTAEFICKFFRKGSSLAVVGTLQKRTWTDRQGDKHYVTEVSVEEAYFVDSKSEENGFANYVDNADFEVVSVPDEDLPF